VISIQTIKDEELENIKGGSATAVWIGLAVTAVVVFISGVIEGITNPERCNAE
jgi:lactobin A/cerein 7B family class IIb bacteriocin